MANLSDEFIALVCTQCGSQIKITKDNYNEWFIEVNDTVVIFSDRYGESKIKCSHCGTEFVHKQQMNKVNSSGGVHIKGNLTVKGDFVARDKYVSTVSVRDIEVGNDLIITNVSA